MRAEFAEAMTTLFAERSDLVFLTVDLGYQALEGVARTFGDRFLNVGIAEQNAVSVAAGLARQGLLPWVYSMAAFTVLRPYAQIRDNVCLHRLPVKLVGNGGGYGYGIMGATHHALEDVAAIRALPHIKIYVPTVRTDVLSVVRSMASDPAPNYLRLNLAAEIPGEVPPFAPWRKLKSGRSCVVVAMGPVVQGLYELEAPGLFDELEIWSAGLFPLEPLPAELEASIRRTGRVVTLEEHYGAGGLGEALAQRLLATSVLPASYRSLYAGGYPSGRYGSQRWHQLENGLAGPSLRSSLEQIVGG
jgi:transketolase